MEQITNSLYLSIFLIASVGAIMLLFRRQPPRGWKPDTFDNQQVKPDPFGVDRPDSFLK
jgi:hypothetical protein